MTIEELKQALEAATPGPWEQLQLGDMSDPYAGLKIKPLMGVLTIASLDLDDAPVEDYNREQRANARLIVEAVNNLPALLKVARAAQAYMNLKNIGTPSNSASATNAHNLLSKALEEFNND